MAIDPNNTILVSIIIPVYQASKTLRQCVDSCLDQKDINPKEIELILIDDGSSDGSEIICDEYLNRLTDVRVRVKHTDNHGVSHARNTGIDMAEGRFLVFVDSDDRVTTSYVSNLIKHADEATLIVDETNSYDSAQKISGFHYIEESILNKNTHVWGKLFDAETIKAGNIRFPEGLTIGEDLLFLIDLAIFIGKRRCIKCIPEENYIYNLNENSAMHSSFKKSYMDQLVCWSKAGQKVESVKEYLSPFSMVSIAVSQILTALLVIGKVATQSGDRDENLDKLAVAESMAQIKKALKVRGSFAALSTGHKIKVILLKINPELYLRLYARHKA